MKVHVVLEFDIETKDYHGCTPYKRSVVELVEAMLSREADLPEQIKIRVFEGAVEL